MYLVSKTETFAKLFFVLSLTGILMYVVLAFYTFHTAFTTVRQLKKVQNSIQLWPDPDFRATGDRFENDLKYILLWTTPNNTIINGISEGQVPFIINNCSQINCYLTTNKRLLNGDYRNFHAIILELPVLKRWSKQNLPQLRSSKQKYIFRGILSSDDHPICSSEADKYFNWTWSYKLYSEIFNPFFEVKELKGNTIAPDRNVVWPPISIANEYLPGTVKDKLKTKKKAMAWVINKCGTRVNRLVVAKELQFALKALNLTFDIYGCGNLHCPKEGCTKAIERDYYFYLVYEDSIADDYVTREVLKAYNNYAIPVVISGADLSKFLPSGSYIDAQDSSADNLGTLIDYTITNPSTFYNFHIWRNYYTFHEVDSTRGICELCSNLNNVTVTDTYSTYENFRKWWYYGPLKERCYPKTAEKFEEIMSYLNESRGIRSGN